MQTRLRAVALLFALSFTTFVLVAGVGCQSGPLSFGGRARYIGAESLARIKIGETDRQWVLAVMGKPHEVEQLAGGTEEIWKYQYQPIAGDKRAYLINPKIDKGVSPRSIYIQFAGATVKDWWQD